jgi:hypothetical protein
MRFFGERGQVRSDAFARPHKNIAELLLPSAARALDLNRAYRAIVSEQSFSLGRDAVLAPAQRVFADAPIGKTTGVRVPLPGSPLFSPCALGR